MPNSLAMLESAFRGDERGEAIGLWSAWSAVSTAVGPLLGGLIVDAASWRWVFAGVVVLALAAAGIIARHEITPAESPPGTPARDAMATPAAGHAAGHVDYAGAILVTLGLGGTIGALIDGPHRGFGSPSVLAAGLGGVVLLAAFVVVEDRVARRGAQPLLPLAVFRSRQFTGANVVTVLVYAALNALLFLLMPQLQANLGYSALAAGAALLPTNILMLALSPAACR